MLPMTQYQTVAGDETLLRDGTIKLHGPAGFEGMRKAGRLAAEILDALAPMVQPGVTTGELDDVVRQMTLDGGAVPATLGYRGYTHSCCISINHVVCHGIPGDKALKDGDIVNIDVTPLLGGWHGDTSRMYLVGDVPLKARRLVEVTHECLMLGIEQAKPGATGGENLKLATPALDLPSASSSFSQEWLAKKTKEDRKREQQKKDADNWLVNGVDKLGRENAQGKGKTPATAADQEADADVTAPGAVDASDPQYLLKLFDDQKKRPDAKPADAKVHATPAPDPFAPFLQNWLGSSPVRDQVLDQFTKKNDAGGGGAAMPAAVLDYHTAGASPVTTVAGGREAPVGDKPNPYLIELNTPVAAKDLPASGNATPTLDVSFSAPDAGKAPATIAPLDPLPDARTLAKGPPPGPADDKKYFPQLKKF